MSDSGQHGEQPKAWTPMTPPAVAARSGQGMLTRIVIGVAALGVMVLGMMQLTQGASLLTGGGAKDATLVHQSFDPANPPALGDPGPAIAAHLQRVAGNETLPDDARRAIDDMVAQTRTATPQRIDEITTLVGATSRGRHVVLDEARPGHPQSHRMAAQCGEAAHADTRRENLRSGQRHRRTVHDAI